MKTARGDVKKLEFTQEAINRPDPFAVSIHTPADVTAAVAWQAERSFEQVCCTFASKLQLSPCPYMRVYRSCLTEVPLWN